MIITTSAGLFVDPEMGAVWASFGAVFTAIAVAHTLYAPREVVLWNWRRILLLSLSLVLAVGSQSSLVILLPLTLGFMLWVAPTRRGSGDCDLDSVSGSRGRATLRRLRVSSADHVAKLAACGMAANIIPGADECQRL